MIINSLVEASLSISSWDLSAGYSEGLFVCALLERNAFLARRLHHQESVHWRSCRTNECQSKQIAGFDNGCVLGIKDVASHLRLVKVKMTTKVFTGAEDLNCGLPWSPHATTRADATCAGWNFNNGSFCNLHRHKVENPKCRVLCSLQICCKMSVK